MIEVEEATEIAEALGLRRKGAAKRKSKRRNGRSCEDCFFHRRMLCALDLDEPCSTFRADTRRAWCRRASRRCSSATPEPASAARRSAF